MNRTPPAHVSRQLRQEAGFGCVVCGCPILDYHHIVEWHVEEHFHPEDMVAVCPTCHRKFAKMPVEQQRSHKNTPINKSRLYTADELTFKINISDFLVGGNIFMGCNRMIYTNYDPLIEWRMTESGALLSARLFEEDGSLLASIDQNDVVVLTDGLWDLDYKSDYMAIRDRKGSIRWEIDLREEPATFRAKTYFNGLLIDINSKEILLGGVNGDRYIGNVFPEGKIGIIIHDRSFIRPVAWGEAHVVVPIEGGPFQQA